MMCLSGAISARFLILPPLMVLIQALCPMKRSPGENWISIRPNTLLKVMLPLWRRSFLPGYWVGNNKYRYKENGPWLLRGPFFFMVLFACFCAFLFFSFFRLFVVFHALIIGFAFVVFGFLTFFTFWWRRAFAFFAFRWGWVFTFFVAFVVFSVFAVFFFIAFYIFFFLKFAIAFFGAFAFVFFFFLFFLLGSSVLCAGGLGKCNCQGK